MRSDGQAGVHQAFTCPAVLVKSLLCQGDYVAQGLTNQSPVFPRTWDLVDVSQSALMIPQEPLAGTSLLCPTGTK